jgi:hypothetical protein
MGQKLFSLSALVLSAVVVGSLGCADDKKPAETTKTVAADAAKPVAAAPTMIEVKHDGKWFVVGSQKSADEVKSGKHLKNFVKAFGAGPKGETVVFEQDKEELAAKLMKQFEAKYPKKS